LHTSADPLNPHHFRHERTLALGFHARLPALLIIFFLLLAGFRTGTPKAVTRQEKKK